MSDIANPYTGEVPFPAMGDGYSLRLRTGDLTRLRGRYGHPVNQPAEYDEKGRRIDFFWTILINGCEGHDPVVMTDLLKAALKTNGGKTPVTDLDFEDLPFPLEEAEAPLMDAIFMSRWGKTVDQYAAEIRAAAEATGAAIDGAADPLMSSGTDESTTSSTASSEPDTEQASTQTTAGN